jgi:hypothetical protein
MRIILDMYGNMALALPISVFFGRKYILLFIYFHFYKNYINSDREIIDRGFQLFLTFRLGYHIKMFKDRFFLEPNLAFTYWPINTNVPESFSELESKWPNYFLFEPGLHFGITF